MKTMVSTAGIPDAVHVTDVLPPGAKAGPWIVERELGRGGMGAVYAVVHEEIGKRAALKVVHQRLLGAGFNTDRMLLEAKVVNQVGHPNIVDIFEAGRLADGRPYIVMERLDGLTLSSRADDTKLLPDLVIAILLQLCDALIAAHAAGIVHRDLKLDNVFLIDNPDDPTTPKVKILDWGIAKVMSHDVRHTIEGQLVGTPQYLSPEQARGQEVSEKTDVYSLGVMAYELFLEQLPFEAETAAEVMTMHLRNAPPPPGDLWPDVPPALEKLLLAMLMKQADERPTMLEVARRLEAVRAELDVRRATHHAPSRRSASSLAAARVSWRSSAELAAGPPGRTRTRRWQYSLGACALAASGILFWLARDGDQIAVAATASAAHATDLGDARLAPAAGSLADEITPTPVAPPANADVQLTTAELQLTTAELDAIELDDRSPGARGASPPARTATRRIAVPARVAPNRQAPTARSTAPGSAPASSFPVAPRRGTKVDPDGTIDPYL